MIHAVARTDYISDVAAAAYDDDDEDEGDKEIEAEITVVQYDTAPAPSRYKDTWGR